MRARFRTSPNCPRRTDTFAVAASDWKGLAQTWGFVETDPEQAAHIVETWAYDPADLSDARTVDPLSLYTQFRDHRDERISRLRTDVGENGVVAGIEKFREYFAAHGDQYAIIGGAACDLLFNAVGLNFRATKDIDMVLCVGVVDVAFGTTFSAFLDAGGYQSRREAMGRRILSLPPTDRSEFPFHDRAFFRGGGGRCDKPNEGVLKRWPSKAPQEEGICDGYRTALRMYESARQYLVGGGWPAHEVTQCEQAIEQASRGVREACP